MSLAAASSVAGRELAVQSPDGRNGVTLIDDVGAIQYSIIRDEKQLVGPSPFGPTLPHVGSLAENSRIESSRLDRIDEQFRLSWGKVRDVSHRGNCVVATLRHATGREWTVELRAYDDGVAMRYRVSRGQGSEALIADEATEFAVHGDPLVMFNVLEGFTTSHEALYERKPFADVPSNKLFDCPLLLLWPDGPAAAITEARVRDFAGMYLERTADGPLECRLSPLPGRAGIAVEGKEELASPWRVVLLGDNAGRLTESNLLVCLNDPPDGDFAWARPGKTTFPWWNGEFEEDYKAPSPHDAFVARNRAYIDFCAAHGIAYHGVHGDGRSWYQQADEFGYGDPDPKADVCTPRPEMGLPEIFAYAQEKGVGIRLWVHWKPLSAKLDEALALYESWGVKGLMVDFLDRDDQEMLAFVDRMLESAARHHVHLQIHGSSKSSGEQRTFPHLLNREGVLNLEYLKWNDRCSPQHNVDVAYTRALTGPVDFHLGGFRNVPRDQFKPRERDPLVLGTRCHHLALYVAYENPMPMVADSPSAYRGQPGFEFLMKTPTTWDETKFVAGAPGDYFVVARRSGDAWYVGGINNGDAREIEAPLRFLPPGAWKATMLIDAADPEAASELRERGETVASATKLRIPLAPGGGFVAEITRADAP